MQDGCCPLLAIDTLSIAPFRLFFYLITAAFLFACLCFCQTLSLSVKYNCRRRRTVLMSPIATRPTHKINNYFVHLITPLCLSLHLSLLICSSCPLSRSEVGIIHGADSHPKIQQKIEVNDSVWNAHMLMKPNRDFATQPIFIFPKWRNPNRQTVKPNHYWFHYHRLVSDGQPLCGFKLFY